MKRHNKDRTFGRRSSYHDFGNPKLSKAARKRAEELASSIKKQLKEQP